MFRLNHPKQEANPSAAGTPAGGDPYAGGAPGETVERPEHIPEKFWDGEKGEVKIEDVFKSYTELETRFGQKQEDIAAEIRQSMRENVPAAAADYLVEEDQLGLPEGITFDKDAEDPLLDWWRETAFKMGLDNSGFNEGVKTYMANVQASLPDPEAIKTELGENGSARLDAVGSWLSGNLDAETYELARSLVTSADDVRVMEAIIEKTKGAPLAGGEQPAEPELTKADVESMMNDPRYFSTTKRDPAYIAKVQAAWQKLAAAGKLD